MKYLYNGRGADDAALRRKEQVIKTKYDDVLRAYNLIRGTKGDLAFGNMKQLQAQAESILDKYMAECNKHLANITLEINKKGGDEDVPLRMR